MSRPRGDDPPSSDTVVPVCSAETRRWLARPRAPRRSPSRCLDQFLPPDLDRLTQFRTSRCDGRRHRAGQPAPCVGRARRWRGLVEPEAALEKRIDESRRRGCPPPTAFRGVALRNAARTSWSTSSTSATGKRCRCTVFDDATAPIQRAPPGSIRCRRARAARTSSDIRQPHAAHDEATSGRGACAQSAGLTSWSNGLPLRVDRAPLASARRLPTLGVHRTTSIGRSAAGSCHSSGSCSHPGRRSSMSWCTPRPARSTSPAGSSSGSASSWTSTRGRKPPQTAAPCPATADRLRAADARSPTGSDLRGCAPRFASLVGAPAFALVAGLDDGPPVSRDRFGVRPSRREP